MKNLLMTAAIFVATTTSAFAQDEVTPDQICSTLGELAGIIMEIRQGGAPMSKVISQVPGSDVVRALVIGAYDTPRYSTDGYKSEAIEDFSNEAMLTCFKEFS
jgi:hypothetical protein